MLDHRLTALTRTAIAITSLIGCAWVAAPASAVPAPDTGSVMVDTAIVQYAGMGGSAIQGPLAAAFDVRAQELAVANTGNGRVEYYDFSGRSLGAYQHQVVGEDGVTVNGRPRNLAIDAEGHLLISDVAAPYVDVCDFRGRSLEHIALPAPDDRIETGGAGAIAIASDGRVFVASRGLAGRVHVFSPEHHWLATWGDSGSAPGQLLAISGIAVAPDTAVVVTCVTTQLAVQVFTADGRYRSGFGIHDIGPGRFSQPTGVVVTQDGRIWVVDSIRANLQVFDASGTLTGVVEGGEEGPRSWLYPSAVASDGQKRFAVTELGGNRFQLLRVR